MSNLSCHQQDIKLSHTSSNHHLQVATTSSISDVLNIYLLYMLHLHHLSLFLHQTSSLNQQKSTCIFRYRVENHYITFQNITSARQHLNLGKFQPMKQTYTAFLLPWCQFSQINPAIVRPLPTPAPSPTKNPALTPLGRCWRCLCQGNQHTFNKKEY